jgi:hypothetical protein
MHYQELAGEMQPGSFFVGPTTVACLNVEELRLDGGIAQISKLFRHSVARHTVTSEGVHCRVFVWACETGVFVVTTLLHGYALP